MTSAGNAAGTGARIALLNRAARAEIEDVVRRVEKIETAVEPRFQEHFVDAMAIPHDRDPYSRLAAAVALPARRTPRPSATRALGRADRERRSRMTETTEAQAAGGRAARQACELRAVAERVPFITRTLTPFEVLSEEGLALLEQNADTILEPVGVEFRDAPTRWSCSVERVPTSTDERVRFPRGICRQLVQATAPRSSRRFARNPANSVEFGGDEHVFAPAYGSPFVRDLDGGRRYGTIEDFRNFVKLAYASPYLHHSGGTVCEPVDLPVNKRHYDMVYAHLRYCDKPFMGSVTHPQRARDTVDMARIVFGADYLEEHTVDPQPYQRQLAPGLGLRRCSGRHAHTPRRTRRCMMTPFILAGAMSPATVAGTAAQTLAESLAGMAYVQLVRAGAPVVLGSFASSMSMQSGAPTFGTPEPALVLYVMASLARRLGVPFRSGGALTAAKVPDAQAAYESANTMQPTMLGGVNFVLHAAGWLEGGLAMGYEKLVLDTDQLGMWHAFAKGVDMTRTARHLTRSSPTTRAPTSSATPHTLANFESAFYRSPLADNASFEQWLSEGSLDAAQRANALWKKSLAEYEAPPIDEAVDEELREWVERQKASFPDSDV